MRAEGFRGYQDLKLVDIPKPQISEGRVLVKIAAAGVTPLEHTILSGGYPRARAPLVLGSEGAGVVEDANDSEFSVGSRVMLRHWRPGDRFQPIGLGVQVKLQDFFTNEKIPRPARHQLVVAAAASGELFWVEGLRIADRFKLDKQTLRRLKWQWLRENPVLRVGKGHVSLGRTF